jgi:hypothetical protein
MGSQARTLVSDPEGELHKAIRCGLVPCERACLSRARRELELFIQLFSAFESL